MSRKDIETANSLFPGKKRQKPNIWAGEGYQARGGLVDSTPHHEKTKAKAACIKVAEAASAEPGAVTARRCKQRRSASAVG